MLHDIILFFAGIVVGGMNAVAGGGMLIGFPVLIALGLPPLVANATANVVVLPGNFAAAVGYRKYLRRVPRSYLLLLIPASAGATIGALVLRHTSFSDFQRYIPILIIFAAVLFAFQPFLYNFVHNHVHGTKKNKKNLRPLVYISGAVFVLSIYGGYFGAGFGFVMLAFLGFTGLHNHIHRMNSLKSVITVCIALISIICLYSSGLINWKEGLIMGSGNFIGGYSAAVGIQKVPSKVLRVVIVLIGIGTAVYLGLRSY
jgi:uncharacterized membrane protein YfcA